MLRILTTSSVTLVLCLLAVVSVAQEKDWKTALHGKWKCDSAKTAELMADAGVPDEQIEMAKQMLGNMEMEITEKEMIMSMMGQARTATYEITDSKADKKWVQFKVTVPEQPEPRDVEFTLKDDNMFEVKLDERTTMVFNRVKKDEKSDEESDG